MVGPEVQVRALCRTHVSVAAPVHVSWGGRGVQGPWVAVCAGHVTCRTVCGGRGGEIARLGAVFAGRLGIGGVRVQEAPGVGELGLPAPRLVAPASLEPVFSTDRYGRAARTYGRSFRDLVRLVSTSLRS